MIWCDLLNGVPCGWKIAEKKKNPLQYSCSMGICSYLTDGEKSLKYFLCGFGLCLVIMLTLYFCHSRSTKGSRSMSISPAPKRSKYHSPVRKYKKERYTPVHYTNKDKHSHKRKHRSLSRSESRSYSRSPDYHTSRKKAHKEKDRYYSSPDVYTRRKRNGHKSSPSREKYYKYEKQDRYDKVDKHDRHDKYRR